MTSKHMVKRIMVIEKLLAKAAAKYVAGKNTQGQVALEKADEAIYLLVNNVAEEGVQ